MIAPNLATVRGDLEAPEGEALGTDTTPIAPTRGCQAEVDGRPCQAPPKFVSPSTHFCFTHDPARAEELARGQRLGGMVTAKRFRAKALEPGELGPLDSPEDAMRWCAVAAAAVAEGRLSSAQGGTLRGLVAEWIRGHDLAVRLTRLAALEKQVATMTRMGRTA